MSSTSFLLEAAGALVLVGGLLFAAVADLRTREVSDRLWQVLGSVGALLGAAMVAPGGLLPLALWAVAAALALEHLFPWDDALGERHAAKVPVLEVVAYVGALAAVGASAARWGVGPATVPITVIALVVTVVLARALFELGVLYGGADAKALIVSGVLVPTFGTPLLTAPAADLLLLRILPFSLTLLTDAALLSVVVPLTLAVRNIVRGEFTFPRGFTSYTLDVAELPHRFVWVRDHTLGEDTLVDDVETSADDTRRRVEIARKLESQGVRRVWVTPQLPFLVLLAAGTIAGLLAGNLLLDLFAAF